MADTPDIQEPRPPVLHQEQADDLETAIYRGKKIAEMMATDGWQMLREDLTDRRNMLLSQLLKTVAPDQVGNIATLQAGVNAIDYILDWTQGLVDAMNAAFKHKTEGAVKESAG